MRFFFPLGVLLCAALAAAELSPSFLDYEYGIVYGVQNKTAQTEFITASEKWYNATHALKAKGRFPMIAYSQVQFTPGYPEFPPNKANKAFYPYVSANELLTNSTQRDIISNKRRFDAMFESTLPLLLRANLIDTVVLSGAYTSGVVLSTLRTCSDMDYQIYVIRENVIDPSYTLSQALLDDFFPQQASVISLEAALKALPNAGHEESHEKREKNSAYAHNMKRVFAGLFISGGSAAKWHFYLTSKGSFYIPGGDAYMDFANGEGYKCADRWGFNDKNTWSSMETGNDYTGYKASVDVILYYANTSRRKNGVSVTTTGLSHTIEVDI
ncbi:hypothetical protein K493DRAFT_408889 [Basidiobolus meristosporus CBS 931.73]|uniref:Isochorismatase-like domain-containing protein n=1 Tax=Basidiobolus meristosporus CBS 931.73 TaxID=1314790 RepID=A0A1Y1Y2Y2_9FUNG|nr:hypothetical protein K493DRAFT_408889 [Basidiobolus meristosporus CBS 931.73]|eukprot:ORX92348.1 hypothetical protein K493DRAFT_408889 [Basidiobolus meristosporus CBS 931.73]